MKQEIYLSSLNLRSEKEIIDKFHETIIDTNRGHKFFVDWDKIEKNIENYKVEFNILNVLIKSDSFKDDLRNILRNYPNIIPVIPMLIAVRFKSLNKGRLKVIKDFLDADSDIIEYDFNKRDLGENEIDKIILFFEQTGLEYFFNNISQQSLYDYVSGVEVGLDTHARKNRSGKAMELVLEPIIKEITNKYGFELIVQKPFKVLAKYGIEIGRDISDRKSDFLIVKPSGAIINIEVNYFSGTGSKPQEIVDSYINRQNDLDKYGFEFIWVTDGYGWKRQKNQIRKGFNQVDYLMNLHFVREGLLEEVLCQI